MCNHDTLHLSWHIKKRDKRRNLMQIKILYYEVHIPLHLWQHWTKYWTKVMFCSNSVPSKVTTKRDYKPVPLQVHAWQIEYKPILVTIYSVPASWATISVTRCICCKIVNMMTCYMTSQKWCFTLQGSGRWYIFWRGRRGSENLTIV